MRRDVQLYIQKTNQFYSSVAETNEVDDGNFVNGTTYWNETSGVSYSVGQATVKTTTTSGTQYVDQNIGYDTTSEYRVTGDVYCPPIATNLQRYSELLNAPTWIKINSTITADVSTAPDGALTADRITASAGTSYLYDVHAISPNTEYVLSAYVKAGTSSLVEIDLWDNVGSFQGRGRLNMSTLALTNTIGDVSYEDAGSGWYRLVIKFTSSSSLGSSYLRMFERGGVTGSFLYIWGVQLEQGNAVTDHIPTSNFAVTRDFTSYKVQLEDDNGGLGGLLSANTEFTLQEGFNRFSFDFTPNGNSNILRIKSGSTANYYFGVSNVELRKLSDPYEEHENVKVDLFDFEDINITDKIQDVRDISKIFTEFSQQFTVPASKTNNMLFSHFYNADVVSGFDQRIKHKAFIKIGGGDYKEGRVSLTGSSMKNGMPYSYNIVFYGKTVELKDLIGDDELRDLSGTLLDNFSFPYSDSVVLDGFTNGFNYNEGLEELDLVTLNSDGNPDVFFPFISADSYYFYDSNDGSNPKDRVDSRNIYPSATTSPKGLYYKDLKPAIKVKYIIRAIQEKYGFEFSDDFFNENNEQYEKLSLLLHKEKGDIGNQIDEDVKTINFSDLESTSAADFRGKYSLPPNDVLNEVDFPLNDDIIMWSRSRGISADEDGIPSGFFVSDSVNSHKITFDVEVVGSGEYSVEIFDANNNKDSFKKIVYASGNYSNFDWEIPASEPEVNGNTYRQSSENNHVKFGFNKPVIKVRTKGGISQFKITNLRVQKYKRSYWKGTTNLFFSGFERYTSTSRYDFNGGAFYSYSTGGVDGLSLTSQMPKIKVLEFLTGIFKTFNLTAYNVKDDGLDYNSGKIRVRTLDSYYFDGSSHDITEYVDTDSVQVDRNNLYSSIEFKYDKHKTFAALEALERTGDEFGYELLNNLNKNIYNPLAFDGGSYVVKLPFEKVMYERMNDQAQENFILPLQWGWLTNRDENPITTKPILFYAEAVTTNTDLDYNSNAVNLLFDGSVYDKKGNLVSANYTTTPNYIRPKNSLGVNGKSLNFGSEYDEWYVWEGLGSNELSLFNTYYRRYLLQIYDRQSRIVKVKANLPISIVTKLKMNDVVIISGRRYRLNSLQMNLSTGNADLELMNDLAYSAFNISTPQIVPIVDNGGSLFIFKALTDDGYMSNIKWNVYVNGAYHDTYAHSAQISISSADFGAGTHTVFVSGTLNGQSSETSAEYTFTLT